MSLNLQRKRYFVLPQIQFRVMVIFILQLIITLSVVYLTFSSFLGEYTKMIETKPLADSVATILVQDLKEIFIDSMLILTFLLILVFGAFSLFYTHRISGPIFKIQMCLSQFISGEKEVGPIHIRKTDFFHELVDLLNKFNEEREKK